MGFARQEQRRSKVDARLALCVRKVQTVAGQVNERPRSVRGMQLA